VLLDLYLPSANGADVLQYIRGQAHLNAAKVIIVTANPRMADDLKAEADLVILKPSSYSQIRDFIARFARRHS
jgi:CheY-like chemotaxis protein